MNLYKQYIRPLFFSRRFYQALSLLIALFILAYSSPVLFVISKILAIGLFAFTTVDYIVLFAKKDGIVASRITSDRLSNGDENSIKINITGNYSFSASLRIIDELPVQFQDRNFNLKAFLAPGEKKQISYTLRPLSRGEYLFFDINIFVRSPLGLITRRFIIGASQNVKVYPSYFSLKKYDLMAWADNRADAGNKKIRKIGQSVEFEEIREYVGGDDIRRINWKATARKGGQLMVNSYTDERSQQVYCVIDKGRVMKMPFNGMTLLDYAINSALIISRVALIRQDRAGLVTFAENIGSILPAERRAGQMNHILESLYDQQTNFGESDFEKLYALIRTRIPQRSLIILYTNFESLSSLQRQLPYIRAIARTHLVLVVFFENTELQKVSVENTTDIESLYIRTIAEKFAHEKRLMVRELQQHGIFTILTAPEDLTLNTVNKYLELKARQAI